jgi:hypothetical protein
MPNITTIGLHLRKSLDALLEEIHAARGAT